MSFEENLKRKRLEMGLTQVQVAKRVGIKQPVLAQYERGSRQPTIPTAKAIAEALGCELAELVK